MSAANGQSVANDVLLAAVAAMGGAAASVYDCRFTPFAQAELPADNVVPDTEQDAYEMTGQVERHLHFFVRHTASSEDGARSVVDLRYAAQSRLLLADPTLGGLVTSLRAVNAKWEMDRGEVDTIALVVTYEAQFSTSLRDPSVAGF